MKSDRLEQAIQDESQIAEGDYTRGAFNRLWHRLMVSNALSGVRFFLPLQFGHLEFNPTRGVVKTNEAICSLCILDGLDDGKWHNPQALTYPT